ncbi:MAG TPA: YheO-like PAS domain protein [Fusobacteriaceae bacterium]|nr:YheO-like PAS domain protein [Fusobacteriaceae bacterium]
MINSKLKSYIHLVNFMADFLGPSYEVVLHDVRNINNSIIAIKNGHISGRKVGGPLADLSFKHIKENRNSDKKYLLLYGKTKDGRQLKTSTYFIRDERGNIIGLLGINTDISDFVNLKKRMESFIDYGVANITEDREEERFESSIEEIMDSIINEVITESIVSVEQMDHIKKIEITRKLNLKGVFLIKGSVGNVAEKLKTSEATMYRYIKQVNKS